MEIEQLKVQLSGRLITFLCLCSKANESIPRYHSVTMPLIQEIKDEENIKPETDEDSKEDGDTKPETKKEGYGKQERTFISFTDTDLLKSSFPRAGYRVPSSKICPVTRLPAKYFDPVTELPYANLQAFKIIREAYYQQLESRGDRTDPEISSWLDWREKNKPAKQILVSVNRPPQAFTSMAAAPPRHPPGKVVKLEILPQ